MLHFKWLFRVLPLFKYHFPEWRFWQFLLCALVCVDTMWESEGRTECTSERMCCVCWCVCEYVSPFCRTSWKLLHCWTVVKFHFCIDLNFPSWSANVENKKKKKKKKVKDPVQSQDQSQMPRKKKKKEIRNIIKAVPKIPVVRCCLILTTDCRL